MGLTDPPLKRPATNNPMRTPIVNDRIDPALRLMKRSTALPASAGCWNAKLIDD